jgi:hypothetical protein
MSAIPTGRCTFLNNSGFIHQTKQMKEIWIAVVLLAVGIGVRAQKIDSIFFHLYTDSLKKGTYNYINVDGKLNTGRWLPLTGREIRFIASAGRFEGNSLFIEKDLPEDSIMIKAVLKADTTIFKECVIYIKKKDETVLLKTPEEIMNKPGKKTKQ